MIQNILIEGLIYSIMVLGVFTTFRILGFCDMTVDGSFPLGACILATCLVHIVPMWLTILFILLGGILAGFITATIHNNLHIPDLLAGILTMTMLYSINLRIMGGKANISYLKLDTLFSSIRNFATSIIGKTNSEWLLVFVIAIIVLVIKLLLDLFFHTDLGLVMGALGANKQMIICQGINPPNITTLGICIGNALASLSGALCSMNNGFADVGSGTGVIVSGLASLMLGEFVLKTNKIELQTLRVIIGSIIYRGLMFFARNYGYKIALTANDLKLINGLLIILCLILSKVNIVQHKKGKSIC